MLHRLPTQGGQYKSLDCANPEEYNYTDGYVALFSVYLHLSCSFLKNSESYIDLSCHKVSMRMTSFFIYFTLKRETIYSHQYHARKIQETLGVKKL